MTTTIQFDAGKYQETLRLAGTAWRNAEGKADDFARNALAALVNDEANLRIPRAPKIRDVDKRYKSKPRDRILTLDELSRIVWYS